MFKKIALLLNALSLLLFFLMVTETFRPRGSEERLILFLMLVGVPLINFIYILKSDFESKIEGSDTIIGLWWKRKKLEEKKRISELEK